MNSTTFEDNCLMNTGFDYRIPSIEAFKAPNSQNCRITQEKDMLVWYAEAHVICKHVFMRPQMVECQYYGLSFRYYNPKLTVIAVIVAIWLISQTTRSLLLIELLFSREGLNMLHCDTVSSQVPDVTLPSYSTIAQDHNESVQAKKYTNNDTASPTPHLQTNGDYVSAMRAKKRINFYRHRLSHASIVFLVLLCMSSQTMANNSTVSQVDSRTNNTVQVDSRTNNTVQVDSRTNNTVTGPWTQLPNEQLCENISTCPVTADEITRRSYCIGHFWDDSGVTYHCQGNESSGMVVEFLYMKFMCPKGTFGLTESNETHVRIVCETCPNGRFQPEKHYSPENLKGCTYKRRKFDPEQVVCVEGGPSEADQCYCNTANGYSSEDGLLFCGFSHPCHCVKNDKCDQETYDLIPDGRCVSKCVEKRLPKSRFDCIVKEELVREQTDTEGMAEKTNNTPRSESHPTESRLTGNTGSEFPVWAIVVVIVIAAVTSIGLIILAACCLWKRPCTACIVCNHNHKHFGRDNIKIKNSKVKNSRIGGLRGSETEDNDNSEEDSSCGTEEDASFILEDENSLK